MSTNRYRMTRLAAGDYLLPATQAPILWRIIKTPERDGSLTDPSGRTIDADFLALWRYNGNLDDFDLADEELRNPEHWTAVSTMLPTRAAALADATRYEPKPT